MGKAGRKSGLAETGTGAAPAAKGFVPDPSLREVSISEPKLDVSAVAPAGDNELWLLQLPHDFPVGANVEWSFSDDPMDGVRGRCQVQGVDYVMVPDQQALSADMYATPANAHGSLVPVVRRMTVVRCTVAPLVCFGQSEAEVQAAGVAPPGAPAPAPPADRQAAKKQRAEAARGGAAPAAPSKTGQATPEAEGPGGAGAAAPAAAGEQQGATAAAGQQQQQEEGGSKLKKKKGDKKEKEEKKSEKKKEKKRKASEGEAGAAAAGGDESTEVKKEKKKKKKDKS